MSTRHVAQSAVVNFTLSSLSTFDSLAGPGAFAEFSMSTQSRRSRGSCWTCKKSKRKCDRERPACLACRQRGADCEGYDLRLRWGTGIASRGHFTGAEKPVKTCVPPRPKGRRRDLSRERKKALISSNDSGDATWQENVPSPAQMLDEWSPPPVIDRGLGPALPAQEQQKDQLLLEQFFTTGINVLHATAINQIPLIPAIRDQVKCSTALYQICLALQCYVSSNPHAEFLEHYNEGLKLFRAELSACSPGLQESNLISGLFLCTIELLRGNPWTVHLEGMYRIQQTQGFDLTTHGNSELWKHLLEVMGVMDMSIFVIGRQTPCFGIWRHFRRNKMLGHTGFVESVSGLPHSLLDLYSGIGEDTTDIDLWGWPGEKGSLLQCQLWESHRLAGMLNVRRFQRTAGKVVNNQKQHLPTNEILVLRILSCIDAIIKAESTSERSDSLVINAINYPVFTAGLEVDVLRRNPDYKDLIRHFFAVSKKGDGGVPTQIFRSLLDDLWDIDDVDLDINDIARSRGIETTLI